MKKCIHTQNAERNWRATKEKLKKKWRETQIAIFYKSIYKNSRGNVVTESHTQMVAFKECYKTSRNNILYN